MTSSATPPTAIRVLALHGPNLNLLGRREPHIYGTAGLDAVDAATRARAEQWGWTYESLQSNHEGVLIDRLQACLDDGTAGVLLNPAGLTHTSVSLRDTVAAVIDKVPVVEVHLSIPEAREPFRHQSYVAGVVSARVSGLGAESYLVGLEALRCLLTRT